MVVKQEKLRLTQSHLFECSFTKDSQNKCVNGNYVVKGRGVDHGRRVPFTNQTVWSWGGLHGHVVFHDVHDRRSPVTNLRRGLHLTVTANRSMLHGPSSGPSTYPKTPNR